MSLPQDSGGFLQFFASVWGMPSFTLVYPLFVSLLEIFKYSIQRWLGNMEKNLKKAGGVYFVGNKVL